MIIARGKNIAEDIIATAAYRLAGLMLLPMSMLIERLARMVRVEAARLNPIAPPKATHCSAVNHERRTEKIGKDGVNGVVFCKPRSVELSKPSARTFVRER